MACSCNAHHLCKKDLISLDNNNRKGNFLLEDKYFEKDKQLPIDNLCDMKNIDDENASAADFPTSSNHGMKRIFQLAVVMYGMVFCGMVYGYTSPAFPSLIEESKGSYLIKIIYRQLLILILDFHLINFNFISFQRQ